jgi:hypothetical protein
MTLSCIRFHHISQVRDEQRHRKTNPRKQATACQKPPVKIRRASRDAVRTASQLKVRIPMGFPIVNPINTASVTEWRRLARDCGTPALADAKKRHDDKTEPRVLRNLQPLHRRQGFARSNLSHLQCLPILRLTTAVVTGWMRDDSAQIGV